MESSSRHKIVAVLDLMAISALIFYSSYLYFSLPKESSYTWIQIPGALFQINIVIGFYFVFSRAAISTCVEGPRRLLATAWERLGISGIYLALLWSCIAIRFSMSGYFRPDALPNSLLRIGVVFNQLIILAAFLLWVENFRIQGESRWSRWNTNWRSIVIILISIAAIAILGGRMLMKIVFYGISSNDLIDSVSYVGAHLVLACGLLVLFAKSRSPQRAVTQEHE